MIQSQVRSKLRTTDNKMMCQCRHAGTYSYRAQQKSQAQTAALCLSPQCLNALAPLSCSMIYPPQEKQWKIPSEPLRVTPSLCACLSANASSFLKLGLPSWTPNAANCSFLCIAPAKHYINRDEERALSFPGLYFRCLEISEEGSFWERAVGLVWRLWISEWEEEEVNDWSSALPSVYDGSFLSGQGCNSSSLPNGVRDTVDATGLFSPLFSILPTMLSTSILRLCHCHSAETAAIALSILCISLSHSCFLLPSAQVSLASPKSRVLPSSAHTPAPSAVRFRH